MSRRGPAPVETPRLRPDAVEVPGRIWYGWVVAGAGAVLAGVAMTSQLFINVLMDSWVAEFGWPRGTAALSYAVFWLILGFLSVPAGWVVGRYGMRRAAFLGAALYAAGTLLMGTMGRLWELYLYNGVLLGLSAAIFWGPLYPYVTRWSWERMGVLVAIVTMGMVGGGAVFAPIMRGLEGALGWRGALFVAGAVGGLLTLAAASLLRPPPGPAGPVGGPSGEGPLTAAAALRRHWKGVVFWGLSAGHFLGCVAHAGVLVHLISIGTWRGLPGVAAASVLSVTLGSSVLGRFVFPVTVGRLGPRGSLAAMQGGQTVGLLLLLVADDLVGFYLFALVFGFFFGGEFPIFPVLTRLYYGERTPVEGLFGGMMAWAGVGMAAGAWVMGALFDATGTYHRAIVVAVAAGASGFLVAFVLPARPGAGVGCP